MFINNIYIGMFLQENVNVYVIKVLKNISSYFYFNFTTVRSYQSEHIGQWATPHYLSDVRRGAPSWI